MSQIIHSTACTHEYLPSYIQTFSLHLISVYCPLWPTKHSIYLVIFHILYLVLQLTSYIQLCRSGVVNPTSNVKHCSFHILYPSIVLYVRYTSCPMSYIPHRSSEVWSIFSTLWLISDPKPYIIHSALSYIKIMHLWSNILHTISHSVSLHALHVCPTSFALDFKISKSQQTKDIDRFWNLELDADIFDCICPSLHALPLKDANVPQKRTNPWWGNNCVGWLKKKKKTKNTLSSGGTLVKIMGLILLNSECCHYLLVLKRISYLRNGGEWSETVMWEYLSMSLTI